MKTRCCMREYTTEYYVSDYFTESWHGIALFLMPDEWHFHMNKSIKTMCHCIAKYILIYHSLYLIDKINMTWSSFHSSPGPGCSRCWNIWYAFASILQSNNFNFVFRYFLCSCLCLKPSILVKLILTAVTPMICDIFQRTCTLWSSFSCSFKGILADSSNMLLETLFRFSKTTHGSS